MKNKGLSTIVNNLLIISLGLVAIGIVWIGVQNILEPQFNMTKGECGTDINIKNACSIGCHYFNISDGKVEGAYPLDCYAYCADYFKKCEQVEVEEIWFWHEELSDSIDGTSKIGGYEVIDKKELSNNIEWLNENCG